MTGVEQCNSALLSFRDSDRIFLCGLCSWMHFQQVNAWKCQTIKCREFPLEFCIVQMQHQFHCSMSAHHCFQIAPWSICLWPSYYSAYPVSCWGNLVKQSPLRLSEDKWVLTGGGDHLSPRKHWTPFVWRVPLITGTSSAVPLVTELVDCWAALGSSLLSILVGYRVSTPFLMDILMKINGFMWSPGTWPLSLCQH